MSVSGIVMSGQLSSFLTKYIHVWPGIVMSDQVFLCLARYSHV